MNKFALLLPLLALAVGLGACATPRQYTMTDQEFSPRAEPELVRLVIGPEERDHLDLAMLQSAASRDRSTATRREQLAEIRQRAAKLGADAVVDLIVIPQTHTGFVGDPAAPVPFLMQGTETTYIMRGRAIRYLDIPEVAPTDAPPPTDADPGAVPEVAPPVTDQKPAQPVVHEGY